MSFWGLVLSACFSCHQWVFYFSHSSSFFNLRVSSGVIRVLMALLFLLSHFSPTTSHDISSRLLSTCWPQVFPSRHLTRPCFPSIPDESQASGCPSLPLRLSLLVFGRSFHVDSLLTCNSWQQTISLQSWQDLSSTLPFIKLRTLTALDMVSGKCTYSNCINPVLNLYFLYRQYPLPNM